MPYIGRGGKQGLKIPSDVLMSTPGADPAFTVRGSMEWNCPPTVKDSDLASCVTNILLGIQK